MTAAASGGDSRAVWRALLRSPAIRREGGRTGAWVDRALPLSTLAEAVQLMEEGGGRILKTSGISRVVRGDLFGRPVVVKRFAAPTGGKGVVRRFRPSRARRGWAASAALRAQGIGCSHCLGFLEEPAGRGLAVFAADPDAVSARRWIKAWLHRQPEAYRAAFAADLAAALLDLYQARIYHADTKASNLLVRHPEDPARRRFFWIDLECVRFGVRPTRRQVLRNLVQLNGSVGAKLSERDRLDFLWRLAGRFPWLRDPGIPDRIRRWTRKRLERELRGRCGP